MGIILSEETLLILAIMGDPDARLAYASFLEGYQVRYRRGMFHVTAKKVVS